MKKIIATLLIFGALFSLTSCFLKKNEQSNENNLQNNTIVWSPSFDYLNEDLTQYVDVPKSVYESYEVILEAKAEEENKDEDNAPEAQTEEEKDDVIIIDKENAVTAEKDDTTDKIMEQFYAQAMDKVTFKSIPDKAVDLEYTVILQELKLGFAVAKDKYQSIDEYAADHYGLTDVKEWENSARAEAEYSVKCKLIIFSIARAENLQPTDEEREAIIKELKLTNLIFSTSSGNSTSSDGFTYVGGAFTGNYTDTFIGTDGNLIYSPGTSEGDYTIVYNPNLNIQFGTVDGTVVEGTTINTNTQIYYTTSFYSTDVRVLEYYTIQYIASLATIVYV